MPAGSIESKINLGLIFPKGSERFISTDLLKSVPTKTLFATVGSLAGGLNNFFHLRALLKHCNFSTVL